MINNSGRVLIVDDDEDVLAAAKFLLKNHVAAVRTESRVNLLPTILSNESYDVILLDMNFSRDVSSGQEGLQWLGRVLEIDPEAVVIMITAFADVELAVMAIKLGATDFVVKPWQNEKMIATVSSALKLRSSRREAQRLMNRQQQLADDIDQPFQGFVAESPLMKDLVGTINRVAPTEANVLIIGENGSGKEVFARALHRSSSRSTQAFVSVDMGSISDSLFESELFGHVKGAFTDASYDRAGRFEIASGGTLFLDEIGNLPPRLQSKILTVLEQRKIVRLGSNKPIPIDIRLISATNIPLTELVPEHKFRQDLLYRINTVQIIIPPLRQRREDIAPLAHHYLEMYCSKYDKPQMKISAATLRKLQEYDWPGNVRELQHSIERAVILGNGKLLGPTDFPFSHRSDNTTDTISLHDYDLEEVEKTVIRRVLAKHNGNISHASRELGLTRTALYRRMQKYDL